MKQKPLLKPPSHCFWRDYNLSKHLPVEFATFLRWEGVLTNWKCRKCWKKASENIFSLPKVHKKPKDIIKTMPKACKMVPQVPPPCVTTFERLWWTLQCKLRWNGQKTKKTHIFVWARKRCFDKLVLILCLWFQFFVVLRVNTLPFSHNHKGKIFLKTIRWKRGGSMISKGTPRTAFHKRFSSR